MSSDTISRKVFTLLLPDGSIWNPEVDKDLDLLLDGMGDNAEGVRLFNEQLAFIRSLFNK